MSVVKVVCPHCCTSLHISGPLPAGQPLLCERCGRPFVIDPTSPQDDFQIDLFDEEGEAAEGRPATEPRPPRKNLWVGLVLAVLLFGAGSALVLLSCFAGRPEVPADQPRPAQAPADKTPPPPAPPPVREAPAPPPAPPARAPLPPPAPPPQFPPPAPPAQPPPPARVEAPPVERQGRLPPAEQARVDRAIDRGVRYLQGAQARGGTWVPGAPHHVGLAALPGLTLLECGVPADDIRIRRTARHVRAAVPTLRWTYDLALAILFLDRLGRPEDRPVIRTLALRLVAGQTPAGGWSYQCPGLAADDEAALLAALRQPRPPIRLPERDRSDNSNTQFAVLGLWTAARHDLPLERPLALAAQRFRRTQRPAGGWGYRYAAPGERPMPSMTAAGLLGLAVGHGLAEPHSRRAGQAVETGFRALGAFVGKPPGRAEPAGGGPPAINLYFLWSLERVGVLYNRRTIGGADWYRWGAGLILDAQAEDGSWAVGGYAGARPVTDTCFALLFLKRADLAADLTKKLEFFTEKGGAAGRGEVRPRPSPGFSYLGSKIVPVSPGAVRVPLGRPG